MRKILHKANSAIIYFSSFIRGKQCRIKKQEYSKVVILYFFGKIGDMIMFADILRELKKIYIDENKYTFVLACRTEVKSTVQALKLNNKIVFLELTREKLFHDKGYFFSKVDEGNAWKAEVVLHVRQNESSEDVLLHCIQAKEKIVCRIYPKNYRKKISRYFNDHTYNREIFSSDKIDLLSSYALMIRELGHTNYKSCIYRMPRQEFSKNITSNKYVAVCPGASLSGKCWPVERYVEVINYLLNNTYYDIVFCGGSAEKELAEQIIQEISCDKNSRIYNFAAQTTMSEWFGIIQNAILVISNESAATHIAASSLVQNISIGEQTYGDKWLPYRPEKIMQDDCIPIIVRSEKLKCNFCAKDTFFSDPECIKCYQSTGVYKCVYDVTSNMVIEAVERVLVDIDGRKKRFENQ